MNQTPLAPALIIAAGHNSASWNSDCKTTLGGHPPLVRLAVLACLVSIPMPRSQWVFYGH
jgi:hypothetical protein